MAGGYGGCSDHKPGGGENKILDDPLKLNHVKPLVGSLENADHVPGGGDKKIFDEPLRLDHIGSKIGSLENKGMSDLSSLLTTHLSPPLLL